MWDKRNDERSGYTIPPGYDGSRFRRQRHKRSDGYEEEEEVILIPDSGFAPVEEEIGDGELSVGGIPTGRNAKGRRRYAENNVPPQNEIEREAAKFTNHEIEDSASDSPSDSHESVAAAAPRPAEKLSGILEKFGFTDAITSDELLICAVIFLIASDRGECEDNNIGDILLILALLLGIR